MPWWLQGYYLGSIRVWNLNQQSPLFRSKCSGCWSGGWLRNHLDYPVNIIYVFGMNLLST